MKDKRNIDQKVKSLDLTPRVAKNIIMWKNPIPYIRHVIMTPNNGCYELSRKVKDGFNLYRTNYKDSKNPQEYLGAIEVQYR